MCRLYGFRSNQPTRVECTLVHAQNALMVQSRTDLGGTSHLHGWGIAAYPGEEPTVYRDAWPAFRNQRFRDAAARIYAPTVVAHVRRATIGGPSTENTHPFVHGPWSFAHNGTVPGFDTIRPRVLEAMRPEHRAAIRGQTDSEHLFHLALSLIAAGAAPHHAVREVCTTVIGWCRDLDPDAPIGLNLLLTDGTEMVGTRWGRTLFHVERAGLRDCEICRYPHVRSIEPAAEYHAVVVASEPLTLGERWVPIPEGSSFRIGSELGIEIGPLGLPNPPMADPTPPPLPDLGVRTSLSDEFLIDHRAMADGILALRHALEAGDRRRAHEAAERVDATSGSHIAFEERHLYPALAAPAQMYDDHDAARRAVAAIVGSPGGLAGDERRRIVRELDRMLAHMDDCGRLLDEIEHLSPAEQSALEDRLFEWRERAPRWSRLARPASATGGHR